MSFTIKQLTVNTSTRLLVKDSSLRAISPSQRPRLTVGETCVLAFSLVDALGAPVVLAAGDAFELAVDNAREIRATNAVMAYSGNALVDIPGDWAAIDRATGKISVRLACTSDLFASRVDDADGEEDVWLQLRLIPSGATNGCTLLQDTAVAVANVISKYII
jgi:hypothetical protein